MRIIAGANRGRTLEAPSGLDTRPTTDRVRESIMSSLFSMTGGFEGLYVLDAFAGSGAMGLEALSRGASACVFNDFSKASREVIAQNCEKLGYSAPVVKITAADILRTGVVRGVHPFDLVFLDPPYKTAAEDVFALLERAWDEGLLSPTCICVYEHGARLQAEAVKPYGLEAVSQKKYGKTFVTYLSRSA